MPTTQKDRATNQTGGITELIDFTPSLHTSAVATGDILADVQEMENVFRVETQTGILQSILLIDKDENDGDMEIYLTNISTSWGTEGAALNITDALADNILHQQVVAAADYTDLGGAHIAQYSNLGQVIKQPVVNETSLYVAIVARGTFTATASGLVIRFGFLLD